jgi:hypothetical protein
MIEKWPSGISEVLSREPPRVGGAGILAGKVYEDNK